MPRLVRAVKFGLLNSLILCVAIVALRGLHEGWENIRLTNPPTHEVCFFLVLALIQTGFGWTLIRPDDPKNGPFREL